MANILMLQPAAISALAVSRGSGAANLLTLDPREVWADSAVGSVATIDIDLGVVRAIDTVFLGCVWNAGEAATWSITGGAAGYTDLTVKAEGSLKVPERAGRVRSFSHAFWFGPDVLVRYLRLSLLQPAGAAPIYVGALLAGLSFVPGYNQEWGSGRGVKDTGTVTRLPSGGVVTVEGARYGTYKWSLGDLTEEEVDRVYEMQLDRGETRRMLVVEDPDQTPGLRNRIHYGLLTAIRQSDRRNAKQTRWEFQVEDLSAEGTAIVEGIPTPALTLDGEPLSFGGEIITIGD